MPTVVKAGSAAANKFFNAALFTEVTKNNTFSNALTDAAAPTTIAKDKKKGIGQTGRGAPVVRVTDLSKSKGEEVTMDLFHELNGLPTMGDRKIAGRGESITSSQFTLKINQGRHMVDSGGKMTQQRTLHDLVTVANSLLAPYYTALDDQLSMVHLAGARGESNETGWKVPLATHSEFADIVVNDVTPPTFDRHFYADNATSLADLEATDKFNLKEVEKLRLAIDEMPYAIQPIRFESDEAADDEPFYVLWVTPRQWFDFRTSTDATWGATALQRMQSDALQRSNMFKHPLFRGGAALWNNILIKKMARSVRFNAGSSVTVSTNTANAATTTVTAAVRTERAILLGAQALANAYGMAGSASKGGYHFSMHTEDTDHGNAKEHSIAWMNGKKKIRFEGSDGRVNDHGVAVLDTAIST